VGPVHGFVWRVEKDGATRSFSYDHLNRPRRQDAPEDLIENGSFYVFKPWVLREFNNRLGGKIALYRMSALDSFQIDEPGDFELLELIMRHRGVMGHGTEGNQRSEVGGQSSANSPSSVVIEQASRIKLLVLDFDGVLTDNRVLFTEEGREAVLCDRSDSLGLRLLEGRGVEVIVMSKEKNPVVAARCRKLRIECIQGCDDKLAALQQAAVKDRQSGGSGLSPDQVAYVGNDINDLECMRWVGLPIAVSDAHCEVRSAAEWVTTRPGGYGAVREVCDLLVKAKAKVGK
jgi:YrbI family 3-deoxy-D-manno-octulosonate 8-phosphate phosphatase